MKSKLPTRYFVEFQRTGSPRAMAAVFDLVGAELLLLAGRFTGDAASAEDLVQETVLRAIECSEQFDGNRPLMPWLVQILVNQSRMEKRREKQARDARPLTPSESDDPVVALESRERAFALIKALGELPLHYRDVLRLRYMHGVEPAAIAQALRRPLPTVKTQLKRGKRLLRAALPAELAGGIAALAFSGRGLGAMRRSVLSKAFPRAPIPAALVTGSLAMKMLVPASILVTLGLGIWWVVPGSAGNVPDMILGAGQSISAEQLGTSPEVLVDSTNNTTVPGLGNVDRYPLAIHPGGNEGSLVVTVVSADSGQPVPHAGVKVEPTGPQPFLHSLQRITDASGMAAFDGLALGTVTVASDRGASTRAVIEAGVRSEVRVLVEGGRSIEGMVVRSDGAPVPGAEVVAYTNPREWSEDYSLTVAGPDGRFTLSEVPSNLYVGARADGLQPSPLMPVASWGEEGEKLVLNEGGATLRGRVVTTEGQGLRSALVLIGDLALGGRMGQDPDSEARFEPPARRLWTTEDGRFEVHGLPPGVTQVWAKALGYASTSRRNLNLIAGGSDYVALMLATGATIHGTVRDAAGAVSAGALVSVDQSMEFMMLRRIKVESASDGSFRFEGLKAGAAQAFVSLKTGESLVEVLHLAQSQELRWDPVARQNANLQGQVIDITGQPVPNLRVHAFTEDGMGVTENQTNDQGRFSMPVEERTSYRLEVTELEGHTPLVIVEDVFAGDPGVLIQLDRAFELSNRVSGSIKGVLLDPVGEPLNSIEMRVMRSDKTVVLHPESRTDPAGAFEISHLPPGEYDLVIRSSEFADPRQRFILSGGQHLDLGSVQMRTGGILEVRLATRDNEVVRRGQVSVTVNGQRVLFYGTGNNAFRSRVLPPGEVTIRVWAENAFFFPIQESVRKGETREIVVTGISGIHYALFFSKPNGHQRIHDLHLRVFDEAGNTYVDMNTEERPRQSSVLGLSFVLPLGSFQFEATTETGLSAEGTIEVKDLVGQTPEERARRWPLR